LLPSRVIEPGRHDLRRAAIATARARLRAMLDGLGSI
jgi:hypothetical protein